MITGVLRRVTAAPVLDELSTAPVLGGGEPVGTIRFRPGLL